MALEFEALSRWPRATLRVAAGHESFLTSASGFERCLERDRAEQQAALELAQRFRSCTRLLVVGIGGSAMGLRALASALGNHEQQQRLVVLDHLNPAALAPAIDGVDDTELGLIVISRSGTTIEVLAWLREILGRCKPAQAAVVTTAKESPLRRWASEHDWPILPIPEDVGGRFSVLTPCGLLPAAALGFDVAGLLKGARDADPQQAHQMAADLMHLLEGGHHRLVHFFYGETLQGLAGWWLQLMAESLGKSGLPLFVATAIGPRDQHSVLQLLMEGADRQALVFSRWCLNPITASTGPDLVPLGDVDLTELEDVFFTANSDALNGRGRPVTRSRIQADAVGLGAFFQTWMRTTALLGSHLDIDPFDQPGVEDGKQRAKARLGLS